MRSDDFIHHGRDGEEYPPICLRIVLERSDDGINSVFEFYLLAYRIGGGAGSEGICGDRIADDDYLFIVLDIGIIDESAIRDSDPFNVFVEAFHSDKGSIGIVGSIDELTGGRDVRRNSFDSGNIGDEIDEIIVDEIFGRSTSLDLSDS